MHDFTPDPAVPTHCDTCGLPEGNAQHPPPPPTEAERAVDKATTGWRDGETFEVVDYARLNAQSRRVYAVMVDARWHTLAELAVATGDPEASVSARLRDFRKAKFGTCNVERRRREDQGGTWEYRVTDLPPVPADAPPARGRKPTRPPRPAPTGIAVADDEPMLGDDEPHAVPDEPGYGARVYTDTTAWARNARTGRWQPLGRSGGGYSWPSLARLFPNLTIEHP